MSRYYYDKKTTAEECKCISISKLKEWGCLKNGWRSSSITWTSSWDGAESDIKYVLDLTEGYIKLTYRIRNGGEEEWTHIDQKYPIVSTPCNYGGVRRWFICSVYHNGIYCGRRVGKLYLGAGGKYFACRHCYNLSYNSRNENYKRGKYAYLAIMFGLEKKAEELEKKIKICYRKGRPTKKYLKLLQIYKQLEGTSDNWELVIRALK